MSKTEQSAKDSNVAELENTEEKDTTQFHKLLSPPDFIKADWIAHLLWVVLPSVVLVPIYWVVASFSGKEDGRETNAITIVLFVAVILFALLHTADAVWRMVKKKGVPLWIYISASFLFISWLMLTLGFVVGFGGMTEGTLWLFLFALGMLPAFYSMTKIIQRLSKDDAPRKLGQQVIPIVLVPLVWYLLINTILYSAKGMFSVIVLLLTITATYFFIFLLLRIIYLVGKYSPKVWKITKFIMIFVLPILCFVVTQTGSSFSFFWDYTSPIYYLLVVVNGLLLMCPEPKKDIAALILFFARSIIYLIVTYFFVVISPFYSLSLVGLLFGGIGLLVLAPLFLWAYQTKFLFENGKKMLKKYGTGKTVATILTGFAVVPIILFGSFLLEKSNLQKAVQHMNTLNTANYSQVKVNSKKLEKTLAFLSSDQNQGLSSFAVDTFRSGGDYSSYTNRMPPPFITSFHNTVVDLDGIIDRADVDISIEEMKMLYSDSPRVDNGGQYDNLYAEYEDIYEEMIPDEWMEEPSEPSEPEYEILTEVLNITTIKEQDYYKSMVHFSLGNTTDADFMEYSRNIILPPNVFISDYYLDVLDERKEGLLAEVSSAEWIYDVITSRFLDPGIVTYTDSGISFKVFPFGANERRYTGIEFLYREPFSFQIDNVIIELDGGGTYLTEPVEGDGVVFVSSAAKKGLKSVNREPFYVFAVDCSFEADVEKLVEQLEAFVESENIPLDRASVSAVNYNRKTWAMTDNWQEKLLAFPRQGGFGCGLMKNQLLREVDSSFYPVLIVLNDNQPNSIVSLAGEDMVQLSPEISGYYELVDDRLIYSSFIGYEQGYHSEIMAPLDVKTLLVDDAPYYVVADEFSDLIYLEKANSEISELTGNQWLDALNFISDKHKINQMSEAKSFEAMLAVVKKSLKAEIMSPYTSYIVLELPEQEQAMYNRQEALMASTSWSDFYEKGGEKLLGDNEPLNEVPGMSEPTLLISLLLLFPVAMIYCRRKKRAEQFK